MQASEEKDDSPLLDADISRLIKLSREVGYKKQDDILNTDTSIPIDTTIPIRSEAVESGLSADPETQNSPSRSLFNSSQEGVQNTTASISSTASSVNDTIASLKFNTF